MRLEDNKGTVYDSDSLNELTCWGIEDMRFHVVDD
jgi:hypothetical protein